MKRLALIVLAAGASRRFGNDNKLAADWNGAPLLAQTMKRLRDAPVERRLAVVRPNTAAIANICRENGFDFMENKDAELGVGRSIARAAEHCAGFDGMMIALGDMPMMKEKTIDAVISAWRGAADMAIVAPTFAGRRGHPVIFSGCYRTELAELNGDCGAGSIIEANKSHFVAVPVEDDGVAIDFDERADFMTTDRNAPQQR